MKTLFAFNSKLPLRQRLRIMHQTGIFHEFAHSMGACWRLRPIVGVFCAIRLAWIVFWTVPEDYD